MTRKRVQEDLVTSISEVCPYCDATGHIRSRQTVVHEIFREIQRHSIRKTNQHHKTIFVNANPEVADLIYSDEISILEQAEKRLSKRIVIWKVWC